MSCCQMRILLFHAWARRADSLDDVRQCLYLFSKWHAKGLWPWQFGTKRSGHHLGLGYAEDRVPLEMATEHEHEGHSTVWDAFMTRLMM